MKAWHFSNENEKLNYNDGRVIKIGQTHKVKCKPILCEQGLHGSKRIIDALNYAPSAILWRVELGGEIVCGTDKCVATERTYLQRIDITNILWKFSRLCALDVIHLWNAPDVAVKFLKTGDPKLKAATGDTAKDAAWAAARAATWDAAWAAARAATGDTAKDTAKDAAWAAARAATWDASRAKQNKRLTGMVNYQ